MEEAWLATPRKVTHKMWVSVNLDGRLDAFTSDLGSELRCGCLCGWDGAVTHWGKLSRSELQSSHREIMVLQSLFQPRSRLGSRQPWKAHDHSPWLWSSCGAGPPWGHMEAWWRERMFGSEVGVRGRAWLSVGPGPLLPGTDLSVLFFCLSRGTEEHRGSLALLAVVATQASGLLALP